MNNRAKFMAGLPVIVIALLMTPAFAQGVCPLPPNPNFFPCPLTVDRSTLQEADIDLDGEPDNFGSVGGFCGGDAGADCVGFATSEVVLSVEIGDPSRQSVTCSAPGLDVWFMNSSCGSCLETGFGSATLAAGSTTLTTVKVVVADINGDVCPCGPLLTCTYDVEVACFDGADGDGDGLIDAADPDCCIDNDGDGFCGAADCDDSNANVHSVPLPLETIEVERASGETKIRWTNRNGDFYDVVAGSLNDLRTTTNYNDAFCLRNDEQGNEISDSLADPAVGDGRYFLVRPQNACGDGGYLESRLDPEPRATLIDNSTCAYDPDCPTCVFTGCDLTNPDPICTGDQCIVGGDNETFCIGPTGTGSQGAACFGLLDCLPGLVCVNLGASSTCAQWCEVANPDCGFGSCVSFSNPVVVSGTEYGVCN